jgi:hypothetical protein
MTIKKKTKKKNKTKQRTVRPWKLGHENRISHHSRAWLLGKYYETQEGARERLDCIAPEFHSFVLRGAA